MEVISMWVIAYVSLIPSRSISLPVSLPVSLSLSLARHDDC